MKKLVLILTILFSITVQSQKYISRIDQQVGRDLRRTTDTIHILTTRLYIVYIDKDKSERIISMEYNETVFCTKEELGFYKNYYNREVQETKALLDKKLFNYNINLRKY